MALLLVLAAPAGATGQETYIGERPTSSALVQDAVDVGMRFWHARGVHPCPNPEIFVADSLFNEHDQVEAGGRADLGGCRIWLRRDRVQFAERERPFRRREGGDSFREALCATIVHELGHTAGLEHTERGLMSGNGYVIPHDCRIWRRRGLDRQIRAARR